VGILGAGIPAGEGLFAGNGRAAVETRDRTNISFAPLAAIIVEKRFPEANSFLFVRSDGEGIRPNSSIRMLTL